MDPESTFSSNSLPDQSGEAIAPFGATCANGLGLTTQVPMHMVFWTSGRTRSYKMGKLVIYLQHVPDWQLVLWNEPEGELLRALVWAGPTEVGNVLRQLTEKVPERAIRRLQKHASLLSPLDTEGFATVAVAGYEACGGEMRTCPILHSRGLVQAKSRMKERDTIPKPVGLGVRLQNHKHEQLSNRLERGSRMFEASLRCVRRNG